jgi:hypothetical protein
MPPLNAIDSSEHFDAAIEAIHKRSPVTKGEWNRLTSLERESAFTVAHVTEADVLQNVLDALESAVTHGTDFEQFKDDCYLQLLESWGGERPGHLENVFRTNLMCVLPGQSVSGRVVAASRALYEGEILQLRTKRGRRLALTANHPVLTTRGFVPAKDLRYGEHLLCDRGRIQEGVPASVGQQSEQHRPTAIDEIFGSLAGLRNRGMALALRPFDLHGDAKGTDGKIDIVRTNRKLLSDIQARGAQAIRNVVFANSLVRLIAKSSTCDTRSPGRRVLSTGHRPTNARANLSASPRPLIWRKPRPHDLSRLANSTPRHVLSAKQIVDLFIRKSRRRGQVWNGLAGLVALDQVLLKLNREIGFQPACFGSPANLHALGTKPSGQGGTAKADLLGKLLYRNPGLVELDQIVEIGNQNLRSHVYDLQTEDGFYSTEQIYISNCSYNEGRHSIMSAPTVKEARPIWRLDATMDDRICEECEEMAGTTLPADDPWWDTHYPPLHYSDRCVVTPLSQDEAGQAGGVDEEGPDVELDGDFGDIPSKEGENWDFDLSRFDPDLREILEEKLAEYRDGGGED